MNKIYNNLNIENLIKTEWFNQFNKQQKKEILTGIESKVDISWYTKPEFNKEQMKQIRLSLENNVDVSLFAKKEFNEHQMLEISLGLKQFQKNLSILTTNKRFNNIPIKYT